MATAVPIPRVIEDLASLIAEVVELIAKGVSQEDAVASTLSAFSLAADVEAEVLRRGLAHLVNRERQHQNEGQPTAAFRPSVVAPGKKSEWAAFSLAYPTLSSVVFLMPRGQVSLGQFAVPDWDWLQTHAQSQARSAIARAKTAIEAKKLLALRNVAVTSELPAADLAVLESAAEKAWRS